MTAADTKNEAMSVVSFSPSEDEMNYNKVKNLRKTNQNIGNQIQSLHLPYANRESESQYELNSQILRITALDNIEENQKNEGLVIRNTNLTDFEDQSPILK